LVATAATSTVDRAGCERATRRPTTGMATIAAHSTAPTRRLRATRGESCRGENLSSEQPEEPRAI
jgi:hypothetical protein